jgi:hypothetical protein
VKFYPNLLPASQKIELPHRLLTILAIMLPGNPYQRHLVEQPKGQTRRYVGNRRVTNSGRRKKEEKE